MTTTLALVDDPLFYEHRVPAGHPERPERLDAARAALAHTELGFPRLALRARDASNHELARVHTSRYLDELGRSAGRTGYFDADTYFMEASVAAALRAAGAAVELSEALLEGRASFGVALLRPPGHHARADTAMGFCLLNNVAVAAAHARARGAERVLIVDWDVHHGNGTQEMFYADPTVLYVSLHQFPFYPGTGDAGEIGAEQGRGFTVNVPLARGADDAVYAAAMDRLIGPVIEQFAPSLVLVSAGFDAHRRDPIGQMALTEAAFARMTLKLRGAAGGSTPIGFLLEGGYDLAGLGASLRATLEALDEPLGSAVSDGAPPALSDRHELDLDRARRALEPYWRF
jgi:acetoin utilization deacetylase AcuC-like enzyme